MRLRFSYACSVSASDILQPSATAVERQRLTHVGRLRLGAFDPAFVAPDSLALPMGVASDEVFQLWHGTNSAQWKCALLATGAEAVVFEYRTALVLDYTIQSSFELGCPQLECDWEHECIGEECGLCIWCTK
ncbi:MAG: hypothetical protein JNK05_05290 [Myxococcales bacterium]|nr:hypothetical protein [Myxococcales bacterium]